MAEGAAQPKASGQIEGQDVAVLGSEAVGQPHLRAFNADHLLDFRGPVAQYLAIELRFKVLEE
ncbi:hypothetical protein GCM10023081_21510 [Arthrobacter ginkgonis]|uniref:Uncharacterized protein n=1 Tax=Arthrobacter ginkgonis TaxID=1630594 RepID=A0ABP7CB23_9MICC